MPTTLPIICRRHRSPWPGQRIAFVLVGLAGLPILLAKAVAAALLWLDPGQPD